MSMNAVGLPQEQAGHLMSVPDVADACHGKAAFRQLRHQTKNALQRLLSIIDAAPELQGDERSTLRDSLQLRILVAADLSDALFGFQREPGDLTNRLERLCLGMVALVAENGARITVSVSVEGSCPARLHSFFVRLAHELVGNAVKHGMYQRTHGTIGVHLRSTASVTRLVVDDNGWGCGHSGFEPGEGLSIVQAMLRELDGTFAIARSTEQTVATVTIRHTEMEAGQAKADGTRVAGWHAGHTAKTGWTSATAPTPAMDPFATSRHNAPINRPQLRPRR